MMYAFLVVSVVQGYHGYTDIWDAAIDELELPCEREPGNSHYPSAIYYVHTSMLTWFGSDQHRSVRKGVRFTRVTVA